MLLYIYFRKTMVLRIFSLAVRLHKVSKKREIAHCFRENCEYFPLTEISFRVIILAPTNMKTENTGSKPTIFDIQKALGYSISTISKAYRPQSDIADETRRKILEYGEQIGYDPRHSNLPKSRIAVIWCKRIQKDTPLARAVDSFQRYASKHRGIVDVIEANTNDFDLEKFLAENEYRGALVLEVTYNSPIFHTLKTVQCPIVTFGEQLTQNKFVSNVSSDISHAAASTIDRLVNLGHKNIAFIGLEHSDVAHADRFAGYISGLMRNELRYRHDLTFFGDLSKQSGEEAAEYFLQCNKFVTAALCTSDVLAEGFISYMKRMKKEIPQDYSVVAFSDSKSVQDTDFPFTSIVQDFVEMGEQAYKALQVTMQGYPAQHIIVNCSLVDETLTCSPRR